MRSRPLDPSELSSSDCPDLEDLDSGSSLLVGSKSVNAICCRELSVRLPKDPESSLGAVGSHAHCSFDLDGDSPGLSVEPGSIDLCLRVTLLLDHSLLDSMPETGGSMLTHCNELPPLRDRDLLDTLRAAFSEPLLLDFRRSERSPSSIHSIVVPRGRSSLCCY